MSKPVILILVGCMVFGLGVGAYVYFSKRTVSQDVTGTIPTPTIAAERILWDDPAGFTMQYPEALSVNKHDEDKVNYAHVELTDPEHPGGLIVWVKDLPRGVTDTASWAKKAATPSSAISFDTTLGNQPAKKLLVSGAAKTVTAGVVWDGVLWYVEANLVDEPYWQSVYDMVTTSFTFKPLPKEPASSGGAPSGDTVDEEEILD